MRSTLLAPLPISSKVSASNTLGALGALVANPKLSSHGLFTLDSSGDSPSVAFSQWAWFPQEKGQRVADIPALLERSEDSSRASGSRRLNLPSFPVSLRTLLAPDCLKVYLW